MPGIMSEGSATSVCPHVCSTAKNPMSAPRCWGSAAMVRKRLGGRAEQDAVDLRFVLEGDGRHVVRHGKDDVEVLGSLGSRRSDARSTERVPAIDISDSVDSHRSYTRAVGDHTRRIVRDGRRGRRCGRSRSQS